MAVSLPPFPKEHELNGDLTLVEGSDGKASLTNTGNEGAPSLPVHPQVSLSNDSLAFLKNEILTPELDIPPPPTCGLWQPREVIMFPLSTIS